MLVMLAHRHVLFADAVRVGPIVASPLTPGILHGSQDSPVPHVQCAPSAAQMPASTSHWERHGGGGGGAGGCGGLGGGGGWMQ
jgi:uncharacterized membrane protein